MSVFRTETVACPSCGAQVHFDVVYSINADRRPDLREGILDGSFQSETCDACDRSFRLDPELTYLDSARMQWLLVRPAAELPQWPELEREANRTFQQAYGPKAPPAVQQIGRELQVRITFGWAALREKLLCGEHRLDDRNIELVKIALLRALDDSPVADDTELRLIGVEANELSLAWMKSANEGAVEFLRAPRALYDEIAADQVGWRELREEVSAGPFVDMHRLLIASTEQASA